MNHWLCPHCQDFNPKSRFSCECGWHRVRGRMETRERIQKLKTQGIPSDIRVTGYWKYVFDIDFTLCGKPMWLKCGGDRDSIYRFDPFGGWVEWEVAGIIDIGEYVH